MKKSFIITGILLCAGVLLSFSQQTSGKGKLINYTEGGALIGNSENAKEAPFIFHSSLNYELYKNVSAGVGVGVEFLNETYLPVTANVLYQFKRNKTISPFIRFRTGYQIALESTTTMYNYNYYPSYSSYYPYPYYQTWEKLKARGGWMFDPSVGIIIYTRAGLGLSLAAGYRYQKLKYTGENDYTLFTEYNRLLLTLGITF